MHAPSTPMRAAVLALLVLCVAVNGRMEQHGVKRRADAHRELRERQIVGGPGDVGTNQNTAASASTPAATDLTPVDEPTSSAGNPLNPLTNLLPVASSTTAPVSVTPTSSSTLASSSAPSSATSLSASSSVRSSSSTVTSASSESLDVINVTQTSVIQASLSSAQAASASSSSATKDDSGGGLNKTSIIAIIAIASSIGLIAAVWTIFRKWKLSPSRQFEDKLTPINWSPDMPGAHRSEDKLALTRSNSDGSSHKGGSAVGAGMRRQNSWGSANGSQHGYGARTDMSEIPYPNTAMAPAYPPANNYAAYADHGYAEQAYPHQALRSANPYENLQRQPTGFTANGGRYGEGYRSNNY